MKVKCNCCGAEFERPVLPPGSLRTSRTFEPVCSCARAGQCRECHQCLNHCACAKSEGANG